MEIDLYQPCPCYSGKKTKFCCAKDIVSDLNQILGKSAAGQLKAAVDEIDRVVGRVGQRDCLSILKTHLLIQMSEFEQAAVCNDEFLGAHPKHPVAWKHRSMLIMWQRDLDGAVSALQNAMDCIEGNQIPSTFFDVFKLIATGLYMAGLPVAARAHALFAGQLKKEDQSDHVLESLLFDTMRSSELPIFFKKSMMLDRIDEDLEPAGWHKHYNNAVTAIRRGQFRFGLKILKHVDAESPGVPEIKFGIAATSMLLGKHEGVSGLWRDYGNCDQVPRYRRLEAEILAILLNEDDEVEDDDYQVVEMFRPIADFDAVCESAIACDRLVQVNIPEVMEGVVAPRFRYALLDRKRLGKEEEVTIDSMPVLIGTLDLYGRQTDREATVSVSGVRTPQFEETVDRVFDQLGISSASGDGVGEEVIGFEPRFAHALRWRWGGIEARVDRKRLVELEREMSARRFREGWQNEPMGLLGGKSATQAREDGEYELRVDAMFHVANSVLARDSAHGATQVGVREALKLPAIAPIPVDDLGDSLSQYWIAYLDLKALADEELVELFFGCMGTGYLFALREIAPEILERSNVGDKFPMEHCFLVLAKISPDDECFAYLQKARVVARENGRSIGWILVEEFDTALQRARTESILPLFEEIQKRHMDEQGVEAALMDVLQKYRLLSPDGRVMLPVHEEAPQNSGSEIWTPDGGQESGQESKIWIPGE